MGRTKSTRPTDAELAILNVLWKRTGISIREVAIALKQIKPTTYATTQTLVRIMEKKGLVRRGPERYPAKYYPTSSEATAKKMLVRDFTDRVFGGSIKKLMLHALAARKGNTAKETSEIQKLLEQMEE
jgi:predicted transcriptional regulator